MIKVKFVEMMKGIKLKKFGIVWYMIVDLMMMFSCESIICLRMIFVILVRIVMIVICFLWWLVIMGILGILKL